MNWKTEIAGSQKKREMDHTNISIHNNKTGTHSYRFDVEEQTLGKYSVTIIIGVL